MKIHVCNENKVFPFLYVDDWYSPEEEKQIWKELDFYTNPSTLFRSENDRATAHNEDGTSLSKSWRLYLDSGTNRVYNNIQREVSHILRLQPLKMQSDEMQKAIEETGPNFRMFSVTNDDITMINYYDDNDYYKSHTDGYMLTTFCWFHRTPKAYTGGDFVLTDIDTTLECKHNRMLMFPCYYFHEVLPIKMKNKNLEMGWGRYALTNFYTHDRNNE